MDDRSYRKFYPDEWDAEQKARELVEGDTMKLKEINEINKMGGEYVKSIDPENKRIREAGRTNRERNRQKRFSRRMRGVQ